MTRRRLALPLLLLGAVAFWLWWWAGQPGGPPEPPPPAAADPTPEPGDPATEADALLAEARAAGATEEQLDALRADADRLALVRRILQFPIVFHGLVLDEADRPVPGARVSFSGFNRYFESSPKLTTAADGAGRFTIDDIRGGSLYVAVSAPGYLATPESRVSFGYAVPAARPAATDPARPAILRLRTLGPTEPLVTLSSRQFKVAKDGTPTAVDLATGSIVAAGSGDLELRAWTTGDRRDSPTYAWRCELRLPGGGLVPRTDPYDFVAPAEGYRETIIFAMPATTDADQLWQADARGEYFARLADGRYARFAFRFTSAGAHFFTLEGFLNPAGSPNLAHGE